MKKLPPLALVATGRLSEYPIVRLRGLVEHLGPVKAMSFRQASRISNTIHAGYPVHSYDDLARSRVVVLCAPEPRLTHFISAMARSRLRWDNKTVLLAGGSFGSERLHALAELGASVGSLSLLPESDEARYLVEGDRLAVRVARSLIEESGGRVLEVEQGTKEICAASISFASWLLLPLMDASVECLRHAGLTPGRAGPVVERLLHRSLRAYLKGGRRAFHAPQTDQQQEAFLRQVEALRKTDRALADLFEQSAALTLDRMGGSSAWLPNGQSRTSEAAAAGD